MSILDKVRKGSFMIGVIHIPPFETSLKKNRWKTNDIITYAVDAARKMELAGFSSVMVQNVGDEPTSLEAPKETVANMAIIGKAVKDAINIPLGICLLDHDGKAPIAVAKAAGADYVRIKTYVGIMAKMTGLLSGCYYDAVKYRRDIRAEEIDIFADIFDREGYPVGDTNLAEMSHFAEYCCMADGLIITGRSIIETQDMLNTVRQNVSIPLLVGGGVNSGNIKEFDQICNGFIIGNCLKTNPSDDFSDISEANCNGLVNSLPLMKRSC